MYTINTCVMLTMIMDRGRCRTKASHVGINSWLESLSRTVSWAFECLIGQILRHKNNYYSIFTTTATTITITLTTLQMNFILPGFGCVHTGATVRVLVEKRSASAVSGRSVARHASTEQRHHHHHQHQAKSVRIHNFWVDCCGNSYKVGGFS